MEREGDIFLFFNNFYTTINYTSKGRENNSRSLRKVWEQNRKYPSRSSIYLSIYLSRLHTYYVLQKLNFCLFVFLLSFSLMRICSNLIIYRFVFNLFQIKFDFHLHLVNYWTHHQFCGKVSLCPFGICFLIIPLRESRTLPSDDSFICQETRNIFNLFLPKLYL